MDARSPYGGGPSLEAGQDVHQRHQDPLRKRGATRLPSEQEPAGAVKPPRLARGVSAVLLVVCLVGAMQAVFMITVELRRWTGAEREIVRLEREVAELRREANDLAEVAMRGDDDRFREHLARSQGYVYPTETRYLLPVGP